MATTKADKKTEPEAPEVEETPQPPADSAVEAEATGAGKVKINFDGLIFTVPSSFEDWPVEAEMFLEQGYDALATRALLGEDQWALFAATNPTVRQRKALVMEINKSFNTASEEKAAESGN